MDFFALAGLRLTSHIMIPTHNAKTAPIDAPRASFLWSADAFSLIRQKPALDTVVLVGAILLKSCFSVGQLHDFVAVASTSAEHMVYHVNIDWQTRTVLQCKMIRASDRMLAVVHQHTTTSHHQDEVVQASSKLVLMMGRERRTHT